MGVKWRGQEGSNLTSVHGVDGTRLELSPRPNASTERYAD
jgi:hypothetical protein